MKDNKPVGPFGVMGGFMQPQGHVQVVMNLIDFGMHPQAALDAPRFRWDKDLDVKVEPSFELEVVKQLMKKGHLIEVDGNLGGYGRGQVIWTHEDHYEVGTETRCDGHIAYY
jgi:gamma-glutamyltranspeptidase/glutathione hydrolase